MNGDLPSRIPFPFILQNEMPGIGKGKGTGAAKAYPKKAVPAYKRNT